MTVDWNSEEVAAIDWKPLKSAMGSPGQLVAELLQLFISGQTTVHDELYEHVCHQFSHETASFAASVVLAFNLERLSPAARNQALNMSAIVETSRRIHSEHGPAVPDPIAPLYQKATETALAVATASLAAQDLSKEESHALLATVAALHGHPDLAMHLFLCPDPEELSCPECGEPIAF